MPHSLPANHGPSTPRAQKYPSVCSLYLGAFSHADDIRTLSTNIFDFQLQLDLVNEFATSQGLILNIDKCEAVISPSTPASLSHIEAGQLQSPLTNSLSPVPTVQTLYLLLVNL